MLSTILNSRAAIVSNMFSLAAILGGHVQANAMASNIWIQKQQNALSYPVFIWRSMMKKNLKSSCIDLLHESQKLLIMKLRLALNRGRAYI